jgi:hypothetical protein
MPISVHLIHLKKRNGSLVTGNLRTGEGKAADDIKILLMAMLHIDLTQHLVSIKCNMLRGLKFYNWLWHGYTRFWTFMFQFSRMSNENFEQDSKKNALLLSKIVESQTASLGYGMYGFGGSIYNKDKIQSTLSASTKLWKLHHSNHRRVSNC